MKIAIFASGSGSNAEALIKKARELTGVEISFVLSDKKEAVVLERAKNLNVSTYVVPRTTTREGQEQEILKLIDQHAIDWVLLAGYMRLVSAEFLQALKDRHDGHAQVLNIHPSLLPAYPGVDSIQRAFLDKVPFSGISIHYVDEGLDTGPLLVQKKLPLLPEESFESFAARMHTLEHRLYGQVLEQISRNEVTTRTYKRKP